MLKGWLLTIACHVALGAAAQAIDISPERASALRQKATISAWDDGGEVSNFVYRHAGEVFPAAVVKRAGAVRELPVALRDDVASFVVDAHGRVERASRAIERVGQEMPAVRVEPLHGHERLADRRDIRRANTSNAVRATAHVRVVRDRRRCRSKGWGRSSQGRGARR